MRLASQRLRLIGVLTKVVITIIIGRHERTAIPEQTAPACVPRGGRFPGVGPYYRHAVPRPGPDSQERGRLADAVQRITYPARDAGGPPLWRDCCPDDYTRSRCDATSRPPRKARPYFALSGNRGSADGDGADHPGRTESPRPARRTGRGSASRATGASGEGSPAGSLRTIARRPRSSQLIFSGIYLLQRLSC
jgi:hypothetical protein